MAAAGEALLDLGVAEMAGRLRFVKAALADEEVRTFCAYGKLVGPTGIPRVYNPAAV